MRVILWNSVQAYIWPGMSLIKPINIYIILVGVQVIRLSVGWRKKKCLPRRCKTGVTKPWPTRCPLGLAPHICTWSIVLKWHWVASTHHSCPVNLPLASSCDDSDVYREIVGPMKWLHLCSRAQAWFDTLFSGMDCICIRYGPILFVLVSCWRARPRITC